MTAGMGMITAKEERGRKPAKTSKAEDAGTELNVEGPERGLRLRVLSSKGKKQRVQERADI